jgi:UDP-N-acetylmuramoyl-tripeptide--D-alanyl-D-alanine ligase
VQQDVPSAIRHPPSAILKVADTVKALQALARAYRDVLKEAGCKVIGIAGSNGKTTTRHLIHHVLTHAGLKGTQSPKSFNNHLGVPLTLLSGKPQDDFVACEIGTNHPGEIDFLSAIARPDIAVITSIGEEHLEFFKDLDGVIEEEFAIANHFDAQTLCVAPNDLPWVDSKIEAAYLRAEPLHERAAGLGEQLDRVHEPTQQCGMLSACVGLAMGLDRSQIADAFADAPRPPGRWQKIVLQDRVTIIHDAYNANPASVFAAVTALWQTRCSRRLFVFGDMFELGEYSAQAHRSVGQWVGQMPFDRFITIGPLAGLAYDEAREAVTASQFPAWSDDLPDKIAAMLQPGDTVLLKASRGMRLERLIPAIERRFGPAPPDEPT